MCNLYSITTNQDAISKLFAVTNDMSGNLPSMPGVFPDQEAPVVRSHDAQRELIRMRWDMPPPPTFGGPPITNIRNTTLQHWLVGSSPRTGSCACLKLFRIRARTKSCHECVCLELGLRSVCVRRNMNEFKGDRGPKSKPVPGPHLVFGFRTTDLTQSLRPSIPKPCRSF
jgi:hypothetical protein